MTPKVPKFALASTAPIEFKTTQFRAENIKLNYRSPKKLKTDDLFAVANLVECRLSNRSNTLDSRPSRRTTSSKRKKLGHVKNLGSGSGATLSSTGRKGTGSRRKRPISAPHKKRNL